MAVVVKIEMWPGGDPEKKYDLGHVVICLTGGTDQEGDYDVALFKSKTYTRNGGKWRTGKVRKFPRRRLGPYDLLLRGLIAAIRDRSPDQVRELGERNLSDAEPPPLAAEVE
jgi:hypothetical protein